MREFPVFVPWGGEHLATVVAVPDGAPRGVVILSSVPGSPRSHRYQVWTTAAERLAERGIASARFEYRGLDDSTGSAPEVSMEVTPLDQILAVTRFAQRAVGVDRVVAAGNCLGAQSALALAAEVSECSGAVCMLPRVVKAGIVRGLVDRASGGRVRGAMRSRRWLRRFSGRALARFDLKVRGPVGDPLPRALGHARVLFLYDQVDLASRSRAFPKVRSLVNRLPASARSRFTLRVLNERGLERFASIGVQEAAVDALVEWADRCLPSPEPDSASALGAAGPAGVASSPA